MHGHLPISVSAALVTPIANCAVVYIPGDSAMLLIRRCLVVRMAVNAGKDPIAARTRVTIAAGIPPPCMRPTIDRKRSMVERGSSPG